MFYPYEGYRSVTPLDAASKSGAIGSLWEHNNAARLDRNTHFIRISKQRLSKYHNFPSSMTALWFRTHDYIESPC